MPKISTDDAQTIEDLSGQVTVDTGAAALRRHQAIESRENEPSADESVLELPAQQPLAVRETGRLYRLTAARTLAVVAADTEQEARMLAATHDAFKGDWRNPQFASAEFEDTGEAHVFGDVVISVLRVPPVTPSRT